MKATPPANVRHRVSATCENKQEQPSGMLLVTSRSQLHIAGENGAQKRSEPSVVVRVLGHGRVFSCLFNGR
ncbi:hypothetical protein, partial [Sphingomonas melonis]|uniref:hypothetical protein n=1 Tax=Sphingomonas melonis TaxID=152682 RepID=UPI001E3F845D